MLTMQSAPWREFSAVKSLRTMFFNHPRLNVVSADAQLPLPPRLRSIEFDIVILSSTFLGARYSDRLLKRVKERFDFLAPMQALKVAMPQDDYDCSRLLDTWLSEWSVDLIYSICPENWSVLYPTSLGKSELRLGYTSYISDNQVVALEDLKRWQDRKIDVSYRATELPLNFGHLGQMKASLGDLFQRQILNSSKFEFDISVGSKSIISGDRWLEFVESSRFVLVSPSGSSLVDPNGDLRKLAREPRFRTATVSDFLTVASQRKLEWYELTNTMISPRNIEAALSGTAQIAIPSEYSGILRERDHYVPLDQSFDAESVLGNEFDWLRMRRAARDAILSVKRLRATELVSELLGFFPQVGINYVFAEKRGNTREQMTWRFATAFSSIVIPTALRLAAITLIAVRRVSRVLKRVLSCRC